MVADLTKWPELARIQERYAEKPSKQEALLAMAAPLAQRFVALLDRQEALNRELDQRAAQGYNTMATNANGVGQITVAPGIDTLHRLPMDALAPDPYDKIPPEDKELMVKCLEELGPQIRVQTEELIKTEIRDSMMLGGNWIRLKQLIQSGAKPRVLRKRQGGRDPLFLVFGDGVTTEIEEVRVLG